MRALLLLTSCAMAASLVPCRILTRDNNASWQVERPCALSTSTVAGPPEPIEWSSPFTLQVANKTLALDMSPVHRAVAVGKAWWQPVDMKCTHNYTASFYCKGKAKIVLNT